jgi:hypothetical protein
MDRKALWWAVLVIGVALIVAPLAMGMPGKAAAGQRMLNGFQPIMAPAHVQTTADYYYKVFVPLGQITPLFSNANADKFGGYLQGMQASGLKIPPAAAKDFTQLVGVMKQSVPIAQRVPAGLAWYKPLVDTMSANVDNYEQVNSLPNFNLFTWFFVVPGILLVLLAGGGLWTAGALHIHVGRPHPVA